MAKWSDTVARCGAKKKQGEGICGRQAGWGTDHVGYGNCRFHMGNTPSGKMSALQKEMRQTMPVMGLAVDVDPLDALIACVRIAAGEVAYCTQKIHDLDESEAVNVPVSVKAKPGVELDLESGKVVGVQPDLVEEVTYHTPELNIWIRARQKALDSLARYSKMALDAGVSERQVQAAEMQAQTIARAMEEFMQGLSLDPQQRAVAPELMRRVLTAIEAGR